MTELLSVFRPVVYGLVVGFLLHEATHYFLALVLGRRPSFGWVGLEEGGFAVDHDALEWLTLGDYVIHGAPLVIGVVVGVWYYVMVGLPGTFGLMVWVMYTVVGARNDLSFRETPEASVDRGQTGGPIALPMLLIVITFAWFFVSLYLWTRGQVTPGATVTTDFELSSITVWSTVLLLLTGIAAYFYRYTSLRSFIPNRK